MRVPRLHKVAQAAVAATVAAGVLASGQPAGAEPTGLSPGQRATLMEIAKDTWSFFAKDVDPVTHLPLDNLGPGSTRGTYTSAASIGVYLWSVVSAGDLNLI